MLPRGRDGTSEADELDDRARHQYKAPSADGYPGSVNVVGCRWLSPRPVLAAMVALIRGRQNRVSWAWCECSAEFAMALHADFGQLDAHGTTLRGGPPVSARKGALRDTLGPAERDWGEVHRSSACVQSSSLSGPTKASCKGSKRRCLLCE